MAGDAPRRRAALVTGGASGIGAAVAQGLAAAGFAVLIADLNETAGRGLAAECGAGFARLDVADSTAVAAAVAAHGPFDTLVNCAGIDQHAFFGTTVPADWRRLIAVNLESVLATTHAVLPAMQAAGFGRIVNVASEAGRGGSRGGAVYAAAKGGVIAFTKSIARECGRYAITANVVLPGPVDTPMLRAAVAGGGEKLLQAMTAATLLNRLGAPAEVASAVVYLVSDLAGFITGEVLGVSGGMGC